MIALKALHTSFAAPKELLLQKSRFCSKKYATLVLSKPDDSEAEAAPPDGDPRQQELLARIAMLQAQKIRLTDYLDERSAYLTKFTEKASEEFDQIGQDALKELDEAEARIMGNIENRMQAFEESAELNKQEIEKSEKLLSDLEGRMQKELNEGMFFKNLGQTKAPPIPKKMVEAETVKIKQVMTENAGSQTRRNIYLAFISLLMAGIVESFLSSTLDWRGISILSAILVGLLAQFISEQRLPSETTMDKEAEESKEDK